MHGRLTDLINAAGRLAAEARDRHHQASPQDGGPRCLVAGCVPPLHESYRPDRVGSDEELTSAYNELIVPNIAPYADVLLCETMSSVREGKLAAQAACRAGLPVWVAWTLSEEADGTLRSGEAIEEAVASIAHEPLITAMLLNCSSVDSIDAAIRRLRTAAPVRVQVGAYGNGFRTVKAEGGGEGDQTAGQGEYDEELTPAAYAAHVARWVLEEEGGGAEIAGGCCGIFPEHIRAVADALSSSETRDPLL